LKTLSLPVYFNGKTFITLRTYFHDTMDQSNLFVKTALHAWQTQVDRATQFINNLPEDQLMNEIAPDRNRGIYLVGHLTAYHDLLPEILGLGTRAYPALQPIFLQTPDRSVKEIPSVTEIKQAWISVHDRLQNEFAKMSASSWFGRHESMTDEDFAKEPARNKLSVLLNRTNHLAYHLGQLRLLK